MVLRGTIDPAEDRNANRKVPRLMAEGLLLGVSSLVVLALIFETAADAFSVAAYQTLLAIDGANDDHDIAILAFILLSVMLFSGIVPAYKAGAYIRPTASGERILKNQPRVKTIVAALLSVFGRRFSCQPSRAGL